MLASEERLDVLGGELVEAIVAQPPLQVESDVECVTLVGTRANPGPGDVFEPGVEEVGNLLLGGTEVYSLIERPEGVS